LTFIAPAPAPRSEKTPATLARYPAPIKRFAAGVSLSDPVLPSLAGVWYRKSSETLRGVPMNWYLDVLKKYAVFDGRAGRQEFWMFALIHFGVAILLSIIDAVIGLGFLATLYFLAVLLPAVGVTIRRLHDTDRSGWWALLGLVPILGLALLVLCALEGTPGDNQYGPAPR
jgi:uncharacterized membrane protein YhaH (DUF805 family)